MYEVVEFTLHLSFLNSTNKKPPYQDHRKDTLLAESLISFLSWNKYHRWGF